MALRKRKRPKLRIRGRFAPTIDVFITCFEERLNVVLDTIRAVCAVDYPSDRFRVVVLDDGANPVLRYAIEEMRSEHHNLYYHARLNVDDVPDGGKSGNLNSGSGFVTTLEGGAGEFIAVLDAGMIPGENWLGALVPHFVGWPRMGLVSPPKVCAIPFIPKTGLLNQTQLFYNILQNDPLAQSCDYSAHMKAPSRDACEISLCRGSGYLIRRSTLEVVGGWPTDTLADDIVLSLRLLRAGWQTAIVDEELQYATVSMNFSGYIQKHTRQTIGTLQTTWNHRFFLFGPLVRRWTLLQRLAAFTFGIGTFSQIFLLAALLIIPSALITGGTIVAYASNNQLRWLIRLCFIALLLTRLHEWTANSPSEYRLAQREASARIWMAPYTMIALIQFLLPTRLRYKVKPPESTSKARDHDTPIYSRIRTILYRQKVYIHVLFLLYVFLALEASLTRTFETGSTHSGFLYLLTHVSFPPVLWFSIMLAFLVPIRYAIWPPVMPTREELLERVGNKGVVRPKKAWRKRRWRRTWLSVVSFETGLIVTTVLFCGTFFF
jgi:cellulose synthase/poly-beta-1,6-N-acetylglucosamine synthase-like glycosyltransferase